MTHQPPTPPAVTALPADAGKLDEEIEKAIRNLDTATRTHQAGYAEGSQAVAAEGRLKALIRARCAPAGDAAGLREAVVDWLRIYDNDDSKGFCAAIKRMRRLSAPPARSTEAPAAGEARKDLRKLLDEFLLILGERPWRASFEVFLRALVDDAGRWGG